MQQKRVGFLISVFVLCLGLAAVLVPWGGRPRAAKPESEEPRTSPQLVAPPAPLQPLGRRASAKPAAAEPMTDATLGLRGRVVALDTGAALPDARVSVQRASQEIVDASTFIQTSADGSFTVQLPTTFPRGEMSVTAVCSGFEPMTIPIGEATEPILLSLSPGSILAGTIADDAGSPIAGVLVFASVPTNIFAWPWTEAYFTTGADAGGGRGISGADGTFRIKGLRAGTAYRVSATKAGYSLGDEVSVLARPGESGVLLTLRPTCRVMFELVDATSGEPVYSAVAFRSLPEAWEELSTAPLSGLRTQGELDDHADLRSGFLSGYFIRKSSSRSTSTIAADSVAYKISAPGFEPRIVEAKLEPGATQRQRVTLTRTAERRTRITLQASFEGGSPFTGTLAISISGPPGRPPAGSILTFNAGKSDQVLTLPSGQWSITPIGSGQVGAWWIPAGPATRADLRAAPEEAAIGLVLRGTLLNLRVTDESGKNYATFDVQMARGENPGGWRRDWGVPERSAAGKLSAPISAAYCSPDTTSVTVNITGVGLATAKLTGLGSSGSQQTVSLVLEKGKDIDWEAIRRLTGGDNPTPR